MNRTEPNEHGFAAGADASISVDSSVDRTREERLENYPRRQRRRVPDGLKLRPHPNPAGPAPLGFKLIYQLV